MYQIRACKYFVLFDLRDEALEFLGRDEAVTVRIKKFESLRRNVEEYQENWQLTNTKY